MFYCRGYEENFVKHKLSVYLRNKVSRDALNIDVQNLQGGILYNKLID